uniref:Malectin-like domain-containing protein n=1 Tax=Oryza glumipatula TaxID=40148 RepID=A0A0E0B1X6_9ORYZ
MVVYGKAAMRYPNDPFDRYWWNKESNPMWENITSTLINSIKQEPNFDVPVAILQNAVEVVPGNGTVLNIKWEDDDDTSSRQFAVILHFADFQNSQSSTSLLRPRRESVLPPMLNAYEIYTLIVHDTPTTFQQDDIKVEYGIKKKWMGDPCFPTQFKWDGVECRYTSDNIPRIISIDLANSNLHGLWVKW